MRRDAVAAVALALGLVLTAEGVFAQARDAASWTAHVAGDYDITSNVTYLVASNVDLKLDVYTPRGLSAPNAVVVYYHGGGWGGGARERAVLRLLPYLEMGFTVVNATYRGARVAPAPAAVEDCRCVLQWVVANARQYNFDVSRIVVTGDSAGSHLALTSGLVTAAAGLDRQCPGAAEPKVAAIVNWFGATDVGDLLEGPNVQAFAIAWMGSQRDRADIATRVSPLTYVRPGAPPVLTVHGDADTVVPYRHATRLHAELAKHGVRNELVAVPGGGHGGFTREQDERSYTAIRAFLGPLGLPRTRPTPTIAVASVSTDAPAPLRVIGSPRLEIPTEMAGLECTSGHALVEVLVGTEGQVSSVRLLKPSGIPAFDGACVRGARFWTFEPARKSGRPIEATAAVTCRLECR